MSFNDPVSAKVITEITTHQNYRIGLVRNKSEPNWKSLITDFEALANGCSVPLRSSLV